VCRSQAILLLSALLSAHEGQNCYGRTLALCFCKTSVLVEIPGDLHAAPCPPLTPLWFLQNVLFESKLANMCLVPKIIDRHYLQPAELALLQKQVPEFGADGACSSSGSLVFTHMYDSVRLPSHLLLSHSTTTSLDCGCPYSEPFCALIMATPPEHACHSIGCNTDA
jgi:hypothetical protein